MWGFRLPRFSLFLLVWHAIVLTFTFFNWRYFVSEEESMVENTLPKVHLAFNIVAVLAFVLLGSVLMFWPYRYGAFMLPRNRRNKLLYGVSVSYFSHVLPLWIIELIIIWNYGWFVMIQSISFILLTMTCILETIAVWHFYIWHMSGYIHRTYGGTRFGLGYSSVPIDK